MGCWFRSLKKRGKCANSLSLTDHVVDGSYLEENLGTEQVRSSGFKFGKDYDVWCHSKGRRFKNTLTIRL